jgi:hypothetical protein
MDNIKGLLTGINVYQLIKLFDKGWLPAIGRLQWDTGRQGN